MTTSPRRILVVDNDLDVLDSVRYNLRMAGYEVVTADTPEKVRPLLAREIVHLAIIDIRLKYQDRLEDKSGFEVARELPDYVPRVIFTAYKDIDNVEQALGQARAKKILDKQRPDAALQLIGIVDDLFASEVRVNFALDISGVPDLGTLAAQIEVHMPDGDLQPSAEDVREVLQRLYHNAIGVHVTPLLLPEPAQTLTQTGSVVVRAQPRYKNAWGAPRVVKFGARDEIASESDNYLLIKPFLGGQRLAVLEGATYSRKIGGLSYSLIGAEDWEDIHTFSEVFLEQETETVIDLMRQFFGKTFATLFADAQREVIDLTAMYTEQLHLTSAKLQTALERVHPEALKEPSLHFKGLKGSFRNPITWALTGGQFRRFEAVSRKCLCHGDLHSRNILVDTAGNFWLVDFARVAESHALRDFVELETDIKFNLLPMTDLNTLLPLEQALLGPTRLQDAPLALPFTNGKLEHAYRVISAMRHTAAKLTSLHGDMREYYQALFIHTLNILCLRHINPERKEYALLSAALICQRLEDWPEWRFPQANGVPATISSPDQNAIASISENLVIGNRPESQRQLWSRLGGAGIFFLVATGIVILLMWAMQRFNPTWQANAMTLLYLSAFAIIVFALLGLVTGPAAIEALLKVLSGVLGKRGAQSDKSDRGK